MTVAVLRPRKPERARHPWIFAGEIASMGEGASAGGVVRVLDHQRKFFAVAYRNRKSKIVLRVLSWQDEPIDQAFWTARIAQAVARRGARPSDSGMRLVNAEGDGLPGLVVDVYAGWLCVQISTAGIDAAREPIVRALSEVVAPDGIYERSDLPERKLEGLAERTGNLAGATPPERVEIREGSARLLVDVMHGQKTGIFLDQRLNRQAAAAYAAGRRVANCFAYSGAFGVHAALAGATEVTNIDIAAAACELARANMALNGFPDAPVIQENCFDWLRQASDRGELYGMIVLDPPAFARGRGAIEAAARGYKEINLRAFSLLEPDGILVTCSCSRPIGLDDFIGIVRAAGNDAGRDVQLLEERTQPPDHPVLLNAPETSYLKCLVVRAP